VKLTPDPLPLFPLRTVLFPGGRLSLKIFEARYLDLVSRSLREHTPFGVVCLMQGGEVRQGGTPMRFESLGTLAHLVDVDAETTGILKVVCLGGARYQWASASETPGGLWEACGVSLLEDDPPAPAGERFAAAAAALTRAFDALAQRPDVDLPAERHFEDAGWLANRWCELLPVSLSARQQLMALPDPLQRMVLVDDYLRSKQLI
jgi:uncharacterized protein